MAQKGPKKRLENDIQKKQLKVDKMDGQADGVVRGRTGEETNKMTSVYIDRVNDVQARIRFALKRTEVQKDMRADHWQQLEDTCDQIEAELFSEIAAMDYTYIRNSSHAHVFNTRITDFFSQIDAAESQANAVNRHTERHDLVHIVETIESWGLIEPIAIMHGREIVKKYSPEQIHNIGANIELFYRLPDPVKQRLFGVTKLDSTQVAGQLSQMSMEQFASSANAFVLEDVHAKTMTLRERTADKVVSIQQEITGYKKARENNEKSLVQYVKDENDQQQRVMIGILKNLDNDISEKQHSITPLSQMITALDLALVHRDAEFDRLAGRHEESHRTLLRAREEYGKDLGKLDPELNAKAENAKRMLEYGGQITTFEKHLLAGDTYAALDEAVHQSQTIAETTDLLDQVRQRSTLTPTGFQTAKQYFKGKTPYWKGRPQKGLMGNHIATLQFADGKKRRIMVEDKGKEFLENVPEGAQPIILRPVDSISYRRTGGRYSKNILSSAPYNYYVPNFQLGYLLDGKVYQMGGAKIDIATHEYRDAIATQITKQRAFRATTYSRPNALRFPGGKPFDYRLLSITTDSGKRCDGVCISKSASALLSKEPPAGYTLVLKTIPRSISLSTKYGTTKRSGRSYKTTYHRNVLDYQTLQMSDFAFAKIDKTADGEEYVSVLDANGKPQIESSVSGLEKRREETSRDMMRAIDRDPALAKLQQDAGSILGPLQGLQSILSAGMESNKYETLVSYARSQARPLLDTLNDSSVRTNLYQARDRLRALKKANVGVALGGIEAEIDKRISELE